MYFIGSREQKNQVRGGGMVPLSDTWKNVLGAKPMHPWGAVQFLVPYTGGKNLVPHVGGKMKTWFT